jgi:hypothetical protein
MSSPVGCGGPIRVLCHIVTMTVSFRDTVPDWNVPPRARRISFRLHEALPLAFDRVCRANLSFDCFRMPKALLLKQISFRATPHVRPLDGSPVVAKVPARMAVWDSRNREIACATRRTTRAAFRVLTIACQVDANLTASDRIDIEWSDAGCNGTGIASMPAVQFNQSRRSP